MILDMLQTNYQDYSDGEFIMLQRQFADRLEISRVSKLLPVHVPGPQRHREYADQLSKEYDAFGRNGSKPPPGPGAGA